MFESRPDRQFKKRVQRAPFFVYALLRLHHQEQIRRHLYKGSTSDYIKRFNQHNLGLSRYTRNRTPWELMYVEIHGSKSEALIREKKLKRCNKDYLMWLAEQPSNILKA